VTTRAEILKAIRDAGSGEQQRLAVLSLDEHDRQAGLRRQASREVDLAGTIVQDRLSPVAVHERSSVATDWLGELTASAGPEDEQKVIAEAAMWYRRTSAMVREDPQEFTAQAQGMARRVASSYGESAVAMAQAFLTYVGFLNRQAASGLDQIEQVVDALENPKPTDLPAEVFDTFQPEVDPVNAGVSGTEDSSRAPLMQEIMQGDGYGQGPEKPGGHSTSMDESGGYSEVPAEATDTRRTSAVNHLVTLDDYRRQLAAEARRADPKAGSSHEGRIDHETSADQARIPSLPGTPNARATKEHQDEFDANTERLRKDHEEAERHRKEGASGLDEVQQVVNPHEDPAPTAMPTDVAFPWVEGDDQYEQDHPGQKAFAARRQLVARLMAKDPTALTVDERQEIVAYATAISKSADQWTAPHEVPGGQVANTPATTPESTGGSYADGYSEGKGDALSGDAPTYSDAASTAPEFVQGHTKGFADGAGQKADAAPKDEPYGLGGQQSQTPGSDAMSNPYADPGGRAYARKVSSLISTPESHEDPEFAKGMRYARSWRPGRPLVTQGSAEFEGGLYAGISDNTEHQLAWVERHRQLAKKDARFAARIDQHAQYSQLVAKKVGANVVGPYLRTQAMTSTDLDTTAPNTSPSPTGATPINGPGRPGPLAGESDPAAAAGASPYNGAPPYGTPVVPTGVPASGGTGANTTINTTVGGPMDQAAVERHRMHPTTLAFRQRVQSSLIADNTSRKDRVSA